MTLKAKYTYLGETVGGFTQGKAYPAFERANGALCTVDDNGLLVSVGEQSSAWRLDELEVAEETVYKREDNHDEGEGHSPEGGQAATAESRNEAGGKDGEGGEGRPE